QTDPHRVLRAAVGQREAAAVDGDGTRMQGELELLLAEPCPGPLRGAGQRDLVRGLLVPLEAHHERGGPTEAPAGGAAPRGVGAGSPRRQPVGRCQRSSGRERATWSQCTRAATASTRAVTGGAASSGRRRSISPVSSSPATTSSRASSARRNAVLVTTPSTCVAARARSRAASAPARVGAWASTLASIGS